MKHEEARRRLRLGPDAEAEAHVAGCAGCFDAVEKEDSLLLALRAAKPEAAPAPARLSARVISRWTFRRRLPWLVGAGALAAASIASAAVLWVLASTFSEPLSVVTSLVGAVLTPLAALLTAFTDLLQSRFLDPGWLFGLAVVGVVGGVGFALLYREARPLELRATA
jgi:hypothetical protein